MVCLKSRKNEEGGHKLVSLRVTYIRRVCLHTLTRACAVPYFTVAF